jgi:putative membrane protein
MKGNGMNTKKRIKQALIVIGVIIIPLAYSLFYLGAFWDPYSRLDKLPVAVVNDDAGAQINGRDRNLGNETINRLKTDNSLLWVFTDKEDATAGVNATKYYAMVEIPQDFSSQIASADTTEKKTALIHYVANEKRNFLASQILNRALVELEEKARADVNGELTQALSTSWHKYRAGSRTWMMDSGR